MPKRSKAKSNRKGATDGAQRKKKMKKMVDYKDDSDFDLEDEIDKFHANRDKIPLDSDVEEYGEKQEEVLPVISDSSDEDNEESQMRFYKKQLQNLKRQGIIRGTKGSDSEEETDEAGDEDEEAGLPSRFAWGDKKFRYYGADVHDAKIGLGNEERQGLAALEEKEALELQSRQRARFTEEDLALDTIFADLESSDENEREEKKEEKKKKKKGKKTDISQQGEDEEEGGGSRRRKTRKNVTAKNCLSEVEKISLKLSEKDEYERLKREYPEAEPLYEEMMEVARITSQTSKVYAAVRDGGSEVVWDLALEYLTKKVKLGHFTVMYTLLYTHMVLDNFPTKNHPIMGVLLRNRKAWKALQPLDAIFGKSMKKALTQLEKGKPVTFGLDVIGQKPQKRKRKAEAETSSEEEVQPSSSQKAKRTKTVKEELPPWTKDKLQDSDEETTEDEAKEEEEDGKDEDETEGREATKKMQKNEGLKAYKKRKQKHSRTKHREKYRKALIRRKGQVKVYRPELQKYRGEPSGIRAGVVRSRRIRV